MLRTAAEIAGAVARCGDGERQGRPLRPSLGNGIAMTPDESPGTIPAAVRARDLVGYGRNPPGISWPGGAKVVVNLVLVYEAGSEYSVAWGDDRNDGWGEYADPGVQPPQRDPGTEAHYEFGSRAGVWRLARIFDAANVPVTVSAAAVALELNPGVAEWMRERDHDVLGHGWRWSEAWTYSREEERELIVRAVETFERVFGARPIGWNSRGWPSENTRSILHEVGGFSYHSEGCADDLPYYETGGDTPPILVIPYSKTYNDSRFLMNPGFASPRDFLDTIVWGLDELLREGDERPTMMTVAVHERWSGQAARASAVRQFIEYAQSLERVRFMRRCDIASWWLEQYPPR
jgi:peptidoglycan/xylan/chitin deacetylase (PgdA/CDA1 family)